MPTLNWIGKDAVINHHKEEPLRILRSGSKYLLTKIKITWLSFYEDNR